MSRDRAVGALAVRPRVVGDSGSRFLPPSPNRPGCCRASSSFTGPSIWSEASAGPSYERASEALGGVRLSSRRGAGAGAASLPLVPRATAMTAVDVDQELLGVLARPRGPARHSRRRRSVVAGPKWPARSGRPSGDVPSRALQRRGSRARSSPSSLTMPVASSWSR